MPNPRMTRPEIQAAIVEVFAEKFEIEDPETDVDLRETYQFDSIDAIDLLASIEAMLDTSLSDDEKRNAMDIRTIDDICDYVEVILKARS